MAVHFQGLMDTPQSEKECWTDGKQSSGLGWDELMMRGFHFFYSDDEASFEFTRRPVEESFK